MELINKTIKAKLAKGERCRISKEVKENVEMHMSLVPLEDGRIKLEGWLVRQNPKAKIENVGRKSKTAMSVNTLEVDAANIRRTLLNCYAKATAPPIIAQAKTTKDFCQRVLSVPDVFDPTNYNPYTKRGWGKSTTTQAVNYFANTFGDFYARIGEDATTDDLLKFREDEVSRIYNAQYQKPCADGNIVSRRREQIMNGVNTRFAQAAIVQKFLLEHHPEIFWPQTLIPVLPHILTSSNENIKTIEYEQYIKLQTLIVRCCRASVPYAFAAAGTVLCAERMGESCAPLIGDFEIYDDFGRYYLEYQIDKNNVRTDVLKNEYSERFVAFDQLMINLINLRKKQLTEDGYTDEEIAIMPFGATKSAPYDFLNKSKVSSFVRKLLTLVGCDEAWLEKQADKMYAAAEAEGNREDLDVGAHELRSTIATFAGNGGMSTETLDAYLGHVNPKNKKGDYASLETSEKICKILERCLLHGSLCSTSNPAITPVSVATPCSYQLDGNLAYRFCCETDMYLELDLTTLECGNDIIIQLPAECKANTLQRRIFPDTVADKRSRPVLPKLPDAETVERWIAEAMGIDLTEIIIHYGGVP